MCFGVVFVRIGFVLLQKFKRDVTYIQLITSPYVQAISGGMVRAVQKKSPHILVKNRGQIGTFAKTPLIYIARIRAISELFLRGGENFVLSSINDKAPSDLFLRRVPYAFPDLPFRVNAYVA